MHQLVSQCPPLDPNSIYCNLLQTSHFRSTSLAVDINGQLAGFVSGYRLPEEPATLFVWQIMVAPFARGRGLAMQMLQHLTSRHAGDVRFLETTITPGNHASQRLFEAFAKANEATVTKSDMFEREKHFGNQHDTEWLYRIGPLLRLQGERDENI